RELEAVGATLRQVIESVREEVPEMVPFGQGLAPSIGGNLPIPTKRNGFAYHAVRLLPRHRRTAHWSRASRVRMVRMRFQRRQPMAMFQTTSAHTRCKPDQSESRPVSTRNASVATRRSGPGKEIGGLAPRRRREGIGIPNPRSTVSNTSPRC